MKNNQKKLKWRMKHVLFMYAMKISKNNKMFSKVFVKRICDMYLLSNKETIILNFDFIEKVERECSVKITFFGNFYTKNDKKAYCISISEDKIFIKEKFDSPLTCLCCNGYICPSLY